MVFPENLGSSEREALYQRTFSPPTVTHCIVDGQMYSTEEMPRLLGYSYEEHRSRQVALAEVDRRRTFCTIGEHALTLEEFEAAHPLIELGRD